MIRAWASPVIATRRPETTSIQAPAFAAVRKAGASTSGWRTRRHIATPVTNAPPVTKAAGIVWTKVTRAVELRRTAMMSVSSARPAASLNV